MIIFLGKSKLIINTEKLKAKFLINKSKNNLFRDYIKNDISINNRFIIFRKLFWKNDAYVLFSEPNIIEKDGITEWFSPYDINFKSFGDFDKKSQENILGFISRNLKEIFFTAFIEIESGRSEFRLFDYIENAIEIPEINSILVGNLPNNKIVVSLIQWGSNFVQFGSSSGILKKMVPIYVRDINFLVIYKNGDLAVNEDIGFEFSKEVIRLKKNLPNFDCVNKNTLLKADNLGSIKIFDVLFYSIIETYCFVEGEKKYLEEFECRSQPDSDFIIKLPFNSKVIDYKLFVEDAHSTRMDAITITIQFKEKQYDLVSNINGEFELPFLLKFGDIFYVTIQHNTYYKLLSNSISVDYKETLIVLIEVDAVSYRKNISKPPIIDECGVFFTGAFLSDEKNAIGQTTWVSIFFKEDGYSEYVGCGEYPNNRLAMPKSMNNTLDALVLDKGTRITIYSELNYQGQIIFEADGPLMVLNKRGIRLDDVSMLMQKKFSPEFQKKFPINRRIWSESDTKYWANGSMKIICKESNCK